MNVNIENLIISHNTNEGGLYRILKKRTEFAQSIEEYAVANHEFNYEKLTILEISKISATTKPTFYRYFESKEDFWLFFAGYVYNKITYLAEMSILPADAPETMFLKVMKAFYNYSKKVPISLKVLNDFGNKNTYISIIKKLQENQKLRLSEEYYRKNREINREILNQWIMRYIDNKNSKLKDFKPEVVSEILLIIVNGVMTEFQNRNQVLESQGYSEEIILDFIIKIITSGFSNY